MATLVQSFPQSTVTMLQSRPGSADRYSNNTSSAHHAMRSSQKNASVSSTGYRGSSGPAPTYAFTSTPQLGQAASKSPNLQHNAKSASSSAIPQLPQLNLGSTGFTQRSPTISPLPTPPAPRPLSQSGYDNKPQFISLPAPSPNTTAKPSPNRYRNVRRTESGEQDPNRTQQPGQMYQQPGQSSSSPSLNNYPSYRGTTYIPGTQTRKGSNDDLNVGKQTPELASRYRRRSIGSIETAGLNHTGDSQDTASPHPNAFVPQSGAPGDYLSAQNVRRPTSSHTHTGSSESVSSSRSGKSSRPSSSRNDSSTSSYATPGPTPTAAAPKQDTRTLNVPNRQSEGAKRIPSPLSRPVNVNGDDVRPMTQPALEPARAPAVSPAAEQLAALNAKEMKKPKSKLRRAFSFGSTAELRKATAQANFEKSAQTTVNKRNSKFEDEMEPEQARIAHQQEAAGLGESIYSGQGNFFTGSTDNLSISSTASSASIMLRKMGKGMKKGTRSFVGLFRPKSVLGVPAADGPVNQASLAQISMVTVEAEREKVNVNLNPHDQAGGGTGFPKLERNSMDNKMSLDSSKVSNDSRSRRSIVGGERERAEVLAAVKKGILKRADSNQSSPSLRPADAKGSDYNLPNIPHVNDTPKSSAPSTPSDDPPRSSHRRTDTVTIEGNDHDDYFAGVSRYASVDTKTNTVMTPHGTVRNISFSPRIQFYDTWPSGEYDRRGEIATCNRLTPMLAQQIKEELNTFKMEMEVHESSKVYTHFF